MGPIFDVLFNPPQFPEILLPPHLPAKIFSALHDAFVLVYARGVFDGLVAGVLVCLLLMPKKFECRGGTSK